MIPSHVHSLSLLMTHVNIRMDDLSVDLYKSILVQNIHLRHGHDVVHDVVHCTMSVIPNEIKTRNKTQKNAKKEFTYYVRYIALVHLFTYRM